MLDEQDDARLVARCRAGDESAWEALVERYQRLVHAVAMRGGLDSHAAADVFQIVFARLLHHLPRIEQPDRLQAWIVTTAKRETIQASTRGRRHVSLEHDDGDDAPGLADTLADPAPLADEQLSQLQLLDSLQRGVARLDGRCRELLELLFREDDDHVAYEVIAERMSMSIGSIGPTRARCLDKLRRLLA